MSARDAALVQLDARSLPNWPGGALRRHASASLTDPRDVGLAEQIVQGVLKNLLLLQYLTEHYSARALRKIDPLAQKVIAIALYQLRFLDRIPASAAVDEAVEQMKRFGHAQAAGFVNAVLRKATRDPTPPLPARGEDAEAFAEVVLSHPALLFQRLQKLLGTDDALAFCEHDNRESPTLLRMIGGASIDQLRQDAPSGVTLEPHEQSGICVVAGAKRSLLAAWAKRGMAQVQDATAAGVGALSRIEPGQTVLDRCCGLGTKTLQLHEMMRGQGRLVAMDPNGERCARLRELIAERGLANIEVHQAGWLKDVPELREVEFDRVLVDAPCSNSGVLARRAEARYAQADTAMASLIKLQRRILRDSMAQVRAGGLLIYSTCSVWREENQEIVAEMLRDRSGFEMEAERVTLPSFGTDPARYRDGGYVAALRRRG